MNKTLLGLIVPPAAGLVPPEGPLLYGARKNIEFIARGLAIPGVSTEGFDSVVDRIEELAVQLRDAGAQAVSMMGTSLSFYRGSAFTDDLRNRMQKATGVPCTTMSHAIVESLRRLNVSRVAVATAYTDDLNERLVEYLSHLGFLVTHIEGLSMSDVDTIHKVDDATLMELAERTFAADRSAQGLLISCGGLHTLGVHAPLEKRLGIPVTSSSPAGFWDLMNIAGLDASSSGYGRLFEPALTGERTA